MRRRVVLLSGSPGFAREILCGLRARGERVDALLLHAPPSVGPSATASRSVAVRRLRRAARVVRDRFDPRLRRATDRTVVSAELNHPRMVRDLASLRPDVVVLARCRILGPEVLGVPREGTVNVHPGLLPWIRGNSPGGHALLTGVPLGVTAYRVDEGIDTGPIIERRLVPVPEGAGTAFLSDALERLWLEMTVELVTAVGRDGIPAGTPQSGRFPLRRTITDPDTVAGVGSAARSGAARLLFLRHAPACGEDGRLPDDADLLASMRSGGSPHPDPAGC
jgi:methionyl-tRNA formyltransferase